MELTGSYIKIQEREIFMKEVILNEKTREKVTAIFSAIKQAEGQIVMLIETYLDAINEKGKWQISQDLSKLILEDVSPEEPTMAPEEI